MYVVSETFNVTCKNLSIETTMRISYSSEQIVLSNVLQQIQLKCFLRLNLFSVGRKSCLNIWYKLKDSKNIGVFLH